MYEITDRLSTPYSSICYIQCTWADGSMTRASGVVVGYNDVLTALHVVFDSDRGGWAKAVEIVPAADTSPWSQPFGQFTNVGSMVGRASNWDLNGDGLLTQAESSGDLALLGLTTRIGDATGWLPVAEQPTSFTGLMAGFPARGTGMMAESVLAKVDSGVSVYDIDSSLGAGASGGPLLMTVGGVTSVVGVLSSGDAGNTVSTYAGLFSQATWDWLQTAMASNDTLLGSGLPTSVVTATGTIYTGTSGNDMMTGGIGRDVFTGNGGNDTIDGGMGTDTAMYVGGRASYSVSLGNGVITVVDNIAGRDGIDTLRNVERVKFADVGLAFDVDGTAGQTYRLYQAAFNRTPDTGGLGFWMGGADGGLPMASMAQYFIDSPEFGQKYGVNIDNAHYVAQLYLNALHRTLDQSGYDFWVGHLNAGDLTRAQALVYFAESPENQAQVIGAIQNGMTYAA